MTLNRFSIGSCLTQGKDRRRGVALGSRWILVSASVFALILSGGCRSAGSMITTGNRVYSTSLVVARPSSDGHYALTQTPYKLSLRRLIINDAAGNDFERAILANAGILKSGKVSDLAGGAPIAVGQGYDFSEELEKKIEAAVKLQADYERANPDPAGTNISVPDAKRAILAAINSKLAANYTVTVDVNVRAFSLNSPDKKFQVVKKIKQSSIDNPVTTDSTWDELLYRGTGFDLIELNTKLARTSLISEQYQRQVERLKDSTFFADALSTLLSGFLPAVGASLGKEIGANIDKSVYKTVKNKYGPSFDIGSGDAIFVTAHRFSASELAMPSADTGLFEGSTSISLNALFKDKNETTALLNYTLKVEPIRTTP